MYNKMDTKVKTRKWGNSLGVILPVGFVRRESLKENQEIIINIIKEADFADIFGMIKNRKMSGQKMKDLARKGWD